MNKELLEIIAKHPLPWSLEFHMHDGIWILDKEGGLVATISDDFSGLAEAILKLINDN
jgi:hypothetical protein